MTIKIDLGVVILGAIILLGGFALFLLWIPIVLLSLLFVALSRLSLVLIVVSLSMIFAGAAELSLGVSGWRKLQRRGDRTQARQRA